MKKFLVFLLLLSLGTVAQAQEPVAVRNYKDRTWYVYYTRNFTIVSIDKSQGAYLQKNLEAMKDWIFWRYDLPNIDFPQRRHSTTTGDEPGCMVLCVPDKETMRELYGTTSSYGEFGRNGSTLWLIIGTDKSPAETIPPMLSFVCFKELEQQRNLKFCYWFYRGAALLSSTREKIRSNVDLIVDSAFDVRRLTAMDVAGWNNLSDQEKRIYDAQCMALCLMIRKELGQRRFSVMSISRNVEIDIERILGFEYSEFERTFKRYQINLQSDVREGRTPDSYLSMRNRS